MSPPEKRSSNSSTTPVRNAVTSSAAQAPISRFLFRTRFHPIEVGDEGVNRLRANFTTSVPAALKHGEVLAKDGCQLRLRSRAPIEFPQIIPIRFGAMNPNQLALAKVGEAGQIKRSKRHAEIFPGDPFLGQTVPAIFGQLVGDNVVCAEIDGNRRDGAR